MADDAMKVEHDAVVFLNKAYNDLIAVCTEVSESRWADATDIDKLTWLLTEVKYWSQRVQDVVHMTRRPQCPTLA